MQIKKSLYGIQGLVIEIREYAERAEDKRCEVYKSWGTGFCGVLFTGTAQECIDWCKKDRCLKDKNGRYFSDQ